MHPHMTRAALLAVGAALVLAGSAACGGGGGNEAAGDRDPAASATQPTQPPAEPTVPAAAEPTTLKIGAKDILFDVDRLVAPAGPVAIELDNQDGGVPHNLHVHRGSDATGDSVGKTELEAGPVKQTLGLELDSGEYFYVCDAHPTTMTGTLVVS